MGEDLIFEADGRPVPVPGGALNVCRRRTCSGRHRTLDAAVLLNKADISSSASPIDGRGLDFRSQPETRKVLLQSRKARD